MDICWRALGASKKCAKEGGWYVNPSFVQNHFLIFFEFASMMRPKKLKGGRHMLEGLWCKQGMYQGGGYICDAPFCPKNMFDSGMAPFVFSIILKQLVSNCR